MKQVYPFHIFGYENGSESLLRLSEVTLECDEQVARMLSAFFDHVAKEMKAHPASFGHEHFSDWLKSRHDSLVISSDLIITRPRSEPHKPTKAR